MINISFIKLLRTKNYTKGSINVIGPWSGQQAYSNASNCTVILYVIVQCILIVKVVSIVILILIVLSFSLYLYRLIDAV